MKRWPLEIDGRYIRYLPYHFVIYKHIYCLN